MKNARRSVGFVGKKGKNWSKHIFFVLCVLLCFLVLWCVFFFLLIFTWHYNVIIFFSHEISSLISSMCPNCFNVFSEHVK